jgi:shikimate kinase
MEATSPPADVEAADDQAGPGRADRWLAGTGDGTDPDRHVHVVVLGLPGVGTSTVGRRLARELQRPFVDHDSIVGLGDRGAADGSDVVTADSAADSDADLDALRRVLATHGSVVYAVGGHVAERARSADLADAYVVWLDAAPEVIAARLGHREHAVLGREPLRALRDLAVTFEPRARELSDLRISVDDADPAEVTEQIRVAWRRYVDGVTTPTDEGRAS